jgi:superoxide dismutase, Fe-Mn family
MQVRQLFKGFFSVALAAAILWGGLRPLSSVAAPSNTSSSGDRQAETTLVTQNQAGEFIVPPLPYAYDALSASIDSQTMMLHHDKHHAAYVKNLNEAIAMHPDLKGTPVDKLLRDLERLPKDIQTTVRNNGGGHANHTLFWSIMTPNSSGQPTGAIAQAINKTFGSFDAFKEAFNTAGTQRFGSGWAWLVLTQEGTLKVTSTANQDSPLLEGSYPILGNDLWEHAYYLKYQNRRADYLKAWWNVVNWEAVNARFEQAQAVQR